jgi:hypothetical protein
MTDIEVFFFYRNTSSKFRVTEHNGMNHNKNNADEIMCQQQGPYVLNFQGFHLSHPTVLFSLLSDLISILHTQLP